MRSEVYGISESLGREREWRSSGNRMIRRSCSPALRAVDYKLPKYVWYVVESGLRDHPPGEGQLDCGNI